MDTWFYSRNGISWNLPGPEGLIDPSNVVTMPVRKYTFKNTEFTVQACAEMSFPSYIFYMLSISHPNGAEISSTRESDFKLAKQLMKYAPISIEQYKVAELKLTKKIVNKRRQAFVERMKLLNELREYIKADQIKSIQITAAVDDDSDCLGGIMGVYCGSGIHGNYRDICSGDERKVV